MENLFYGRAITDKFDLKGSVRNRLVNPEEVDSEGELVLLDENLLNSNIYTFCIEASPRAICCLDVVKLRR